MSVLFLSMIPSLHAGRPGFEDPRGVGDFPESLYAVPVVHEACDELADAVVVCPEGEHWDDALEECVAGGFGGEWAQLLRCRPLGDGSNCPHASGEARVYCITPGDYLEAGVLIVNRDPAGSPGVIRYFEPLAPSAVGPVDDPTLAHASLEGLKINLARDWVIRGLSFVDGDDWSYGHSWDEDWILFDTPGPPWEGCGEHGRWDPADPLLDCVQTYGSGIRAYDSDDITIDSVLVRNAASPAVHMMGTNRMVLQHSVVAECPRVALKESIAVSIGTRTLTRPCDDSTATVSRPGGLVEEPCTSGISDPDSEREMRGNRVVGNELVNCGDGVNVIANVEEGSDGGLAMPSFPETVIENNDIVITAAWTVDVDDYIADTDFTGDDFKRWGPVTQVAAWRDEPDGTWACAENGIEVRASPYGLLVGSDFDDSGVGETAQEFTGTVDDADVIRVVRNRITGFTHSWPMCSQGTGTPSGGAALLIGGHASHVLVADNVIGDVTKPLSIQEESDRIAVVNNLVARPVDPFAGPLDPLEPHGSGAAFTLHSHGPAGHVELAFNTVIGGPATGRHSLLANTGTVASDLALDCNVVLDLPLDGPWVPWAGDVDPVSSDNVFLGNGGSSWCLDSFPSASDLCDDSPYLGWFDPLTLRLHILQPGAPSTLDHALFTQSLSACDLATVRSGSWWEDVTW